MNLKPSGSPPVWAASSDHMSALMDAAAQAERVENESPRDYLGGSRLGEECERRLGYEYTHTPEDEGSGFSGRILRVFQRGHDGEARMARYLRGAGFDLVSESKSGGQIGWGVAPHPETGRSRIAGHLDGVVMGWSLPIGAIPPDDFALQWASTLPFPLLWETKCLKGDSWRGLLKHGLKKDKPIYYAQVQTYMAFKGLGHCLFTAENADTCEVFSELVPFDPKAAQEASDRGVRVISARTPLDLARCAKDEDDFRCKLCPFKGTCWAEKAKEPELIQQGAAVRIAPGW